MKPKRLPAATIHLNKGARHRILDGHPWVFRSEIGRIEGEPAAGQTVGLEDAKGKFLGSGIYNDKSQIVVRRYSRRAEALDAPFLERALTAALAYRKKIIQTQPAAQRLVWSESDGLPGLIVDRYGPVLVLQTLTLAMAQRQSVIAELLQKLLQPEAIVARNDAPVRKLEGLPLEKNILHGNYVPPTRLWMLGLDWEIDLWSGQKTGFYLDQMDNYHKVARHAQGRNTLDCFCNQGAFALTAMMAGAKSCRAIDQSEEAVRIGRETAQRHKLEIDWVNGNVFDLLPVFEREKQVYDLIILDPPSFTKTKGQVNSALRGYKELHLRAVRLLRPGGLLATFSCSHHVGESDWRKLLLEVGAETEVSLRLVERFFQSADHPVLNEIPETEYVRGFLLEKVF